MATPKPKPIAAYVSSKTQKDDSQRAVIAQWMVNHGVDPDAAKWYTDIESGRKMTRPEFDRLQRDIFAGTIKTVVVYMVAAVMLELAEIDWEYRKERQAAGIAVAKKKGDVYQGRKAGTTKGEPARAAELRAKGLTAGEIATYLGVSVRTVWRYLE